MINDMQLAVFSNFLGIILFLLVILYHYVAVTKPKREWHCSKSGMKSFKLYIVAWNDNLTAIFQAHWCSCASSFLLFLLAQLTLVC